MVVKEVLKAKDNRNTENPHHRYVKTHKTNCLQAVLIYLGAEIYNYFRIFVYRVIPLLPPIQCGPRGENDCHVFQTWKSLVLRTSTVSHCLRSALNLFGIEDPHGCPTDYRKAASTVISMNNPSMQELLNQFMCHVRSTTNDIIDIICLTGAYVQFSLNWLDVRQCLSRLKYLLPFLQTSHIL